MNYIPSNNAYLECPSYMNNFTEVEYTGIPKEFKETNSESNINNAEQTELKLLYLPGAYFYLYCLIHTSKKWWREHFYLKKIILI